MIQVLSPAQVEAARPAGRFVGGVLAQLRDRVRPGTNLLEIDAWARELIDRAGAVSCYVDYAPSFGRGPFGKVICTSVNDAVLHGLPHDYALRDGDLLTLDFAVSLHGWVADAAVSFVVGERANPADQHLIDTTRRALAAGIAAAQPGRRVGDISHAIGTVLTGAGYAVNSEFGGHGVGSDHAPGPARAQQRPARARTEAQTGHAAGHRAVGHGRHRPAEDGSRRLDAAQRHRRPHRARRTHRRHHPIGPEILTGP